MDYKTVLSDLLSIDTSVPPGKNYDKVVDYLLPLFNNAGFEMQRVIIPKAHAEGREGRIHLICHRRAPDKPRLIFYGHIDVVPAEGWDAFTPRIEAGKMYGRGAADMKGSIVGLLLGLEAVKGQPLDYDISVMITTDEEISQQSQLHYVKQFIEPVAGAHFFCLDSSFGYVAIAGLGALHVEIAVKGKSVHSALSHLGENAVEKAFPLLEELLKLKKIVESRKSKVPAHPSTGLDRMVSRLNLNMIQGGLKVNIVPDECIITIDRRLIPEETIEGAEQELFNALSRVPEITWEVKSVFRIPTVPPIDAPIVHQLATVIKEITGETGEFGEMGSGDLGNVVQGWKGHMFGLGVIRTECNIHGREEFVYLKDVEYLGQIIRRFLTECQR